MHFFSAVGKEECIKVMGMKMMTMLTVDAGADTDTDTDNDSDSDDAGFGCWGRATYPIVYVMYLK